MGFWLTEQQFSRLAPLLPADTRGVPRVDDRRVISGIIHVLRSGCRWKDAPTGYGPPKTPHDRFVRWAANGVWEDVFTRPAEADGPPATLMIDVEPVVRHWSEDRRRGRVKAHRSAAGGKGGPISRPSGARAADGRRSSTSPLTSTGGHDV
jgi:transposase